MEQGNSTLTMFKAAETFDLQYLISPPSSPSAGFMLNLTKIPQCFLEMLSRFEVTVTPTFDLEHVTDLSLSRGCHLPNMKKLPEGVLEILLSR